MKTETRRFEDGSRTSYIYDDAGIHLRTTDYDVDGNIIFNIHYEHNELGNIIGWRVYNHEGVMFRRFEVDYYPSGLESEVWEYVEDGNLIRRTVHIYDSENMETEQHYYDSQGILRGKGLIERNMNGKYIGTKYYDTEGNVLGNPAA